MNWAQHVDTHVPNNNLTLLKFFMVSLPSLCSQVFLLESQRTCGLELDIDEDSTRSFIFIIYPPDVDISTSIDLIKTR